MRLGTPRDGPSYFQDKTKRQIFFEKDFFVFFFWKNRILDKNLRQKDRQDKKKSTLIYSSFYTEASSVKDTNILKKKYCYRPRVG